MIEHVKEIVDGIYKVEREIPGLPDVFTIYFIKDSKSALIDPGPGKLVPTIVESAKELGIKDFEYIIPTHIHMDHGGGSGKLSSIFKSAKLVTNSQGVKHLVDPSRLIRSTKMSFGEDFQSAWGVIEPVPENRIKVIHDGEKLELGGRDLICYETPGHAPHHIVIFDEKTGGLFCGEALGLIYNQGTQTLAAAAPPSFDLDLYISTMERLSKLPLKYLFYAQEGISTEPQKTISETIENVKTIGDFILKTLKTNTDKEAELKLYEYLHARFGVTLSVNSLANNIGGYGGYFKRKGLL